MIVLGAGAAGIDVRVRGWASRPQRHRPGPCRPCGQEILISGGGRCNFTNLHTRAENFISENPHFAKSALARFTPPDMVALVEKHGIRYHEKTLGQLFCDGSAMEIVTMLERECADANVRIMPGTQVVSVRSSDESKYRFYLETSCGTFLAQSLVVATGGLSIPKMGATGFGYEIATQFHMNVVPCRPGLVPLLFNAEDLAGWSDLSGLSAEVVARGESKKGGAGFREKMLITHRGLSGPAILQISSYWKPGDSVKLDLAPEREIAAPLLVPKARRDEASLVNALRTALPARMAERWVTVNPPAGWTNASLAATEERIHAWQVTPAGTEGYVKAEVTVGGVDTRGLDAKTMESRKVPGLFFIGEVVDVTGWLGGYNFQWAWASAVSAGSAA